MAASIPPILKYSVFYNLLNFRPIFIKFVSKSIFCIVLYFNAQYFLMLRSPLISSAEGGTTTMRLATKFRAPAVMTICWNAFMDDLFKWHVPQIVNEIIWLSSKTTFFVFQALIEALKVQHFRYLTNLSFEDRMAIFFGDTKNSLTIKISVFSLSNNLSNFSLENGRLTC